MQSLARLLPMAPAPSADASKDQPAAAPGACDPEDTQFDEVMSQAMAAPGRTNAKTQADTKGSHPGSAHTSPGQMDESSITQTTANTTPRLRIVPDQGSAKTSAKDSGKKVPDQPDSKSNPGSDSAQADAALLVDNAQNLPIQLLAPALSSFLLTGTKAGRMLSGASATAISTASRGHVMVDISASATQTAMAGDKVLSPAVSGKESKSEAGESGVGDVMPETPAKSAAGTSQPVAGSKGADAKLNLPASPATSPTANDKLLAAFPTPAKDSELPPLKTLDVSPATGASAKIAGDDLPPVQPEKAPEVQKSPVNADLKGNVTLQSAGQLHGILAAKQDMPMKNAENTIKVAGLDEKVLPGNMMASARGNDLPGRDASATPAASRDGAPGTNIVPISSPTEHHIDAASTTDSVSVSNLGDIRARALDRTQDMVALHAVRLVDSQADSLSVVIKPGAGMQLSLQLKQSPDGIEAQAVLQHGDYDNLNQHWPELQHRLEERGIKLAPLSSDENAMSFANQNRGQQSRQEPEEKALYASAFAEFSLAGAITGTPPAPPALAALSAGGWQSWA